MSVCYIVGAGEFTPRDLSPAADDFVIAADGGYRALCGIGLKPNLLMGDLDSFGDYPLPSDVPLERFPVHKDDTDTGIALAHGWSLGYRQFALYGGSGGRVDHLLANFQSMVHYSRLGGELKLVAQDYDAWTVTDGTLFLPERSAGTIVSVFAMGERAEGVTLTGLAYPLERATLSCDFPIGVSNERLDGIPASVSVEKGTLLVLQRLSREA